MIRNIKVLIGILLVIVTFGLGISACKSKKKQAVRPAATEEDKQVAALVAAGKKFTDLMSKAPPVMDKIRDETSLRAAQENLRFLQKRRAELLREIRTLPEPSVNVKRRVNRALNSSSKAMQLQLINAISRVEGLNPTLRTRATELVMNFISGENEVRDTMKTYFIVRPERPKAFPPAVKPSLPEQPLTESPIAASAQKQEAPEIPLEDLPTLPDDEPVRLPAQVVTEDEVIE